MKVSVVIPTFNEEKVIGKCLGSLDKQNYKDFEVILVDDGSTDKTIDIARKAKVINYHLVIINKKHEGPGLARNLGANKSQGDILVFVDADMTFDANFLTELVTPIIERKVRGTFSKQEYVSNWGNAWARCWNINEGWEKMKRHLKNYPDTQNVFRAIHKSEFEKSGGFLPGGHYTDDYLSDVLGYKAQAVRGAKYYHENPSSLREVFRQAKWVSKRKYKLGIVGVTYALVRASLPISIIVGVIKSIKHKDMNFIIFKIVYDLGLFVGIWEQILFKKKGK